MTKLVMIGECSNCGATVVSRFPFEIGICHCSNPHREVKLQLAIIPAKRHMKQLRKVAGFRPTDIKKLIAELLDIWL
jgi:hypothetical protein